ncbi:MAG: GntR family transcriptional regulator [Sarcina sp.]
MNSKEISKDLIKKIVTGELPELSKLDSEIKLATLYNCNRHTVRAAIKDLIEKGYIIKPHGGTSYINHLPKNHILNLSSMCELHISKNLKSKILDFKQVLPNDAIAKKFEITKNKKLWKITRARYVNEEFKHIEYTYMPVSFFPDLTLEICKKSILTYIDSKDELTISHAHKTIEPSFFSENECKILNLPANSLALKITNLAILTNGRVYEYSINKHFNQKIDFFAKR